MTVHRHVTVVDNTPARSPDPAMAGCNVFQNLDGSSLDKSTSLFHQLPLLMFLVRHVLMLSGASAVVVHLLTRRVGS